MSALIKITFFLIVSFFLGLNIIQASDSNDIAIIIKSEGKVNIRSVNPGKWQNAKLGMHLNSGDIIKTGDKAIVAIMFTDDKSLLKIRENSTIAIRGKREKSSIYKRLKFALGQIWVNIKKQKSDFIVETPSGTAVVKGTQFYQLVDKAGNSTVICIEGLILLKNSLGEILIKAGETGRATKLMAPTSHKSKESEIPNWGDQDKNGNELDFEFQNSDGDKKTLKINYQE